MPHIEIYNGPSGFKSLPNIVILRLDEMTNEYVHFYTTKGYDFNLPEGVYYLDDTDLSELPGPVPFSSHYLPDKEERFSIEDMYIVFDENPSRASVRLLDGRIRYDEEDFLASSYDDRIYVILHEAGHSFFESEELADMFAENVMLEMGFNPSQIVEANARLLSASEAGNYRINETLERSELWKSEY